MNKRQIDLLRILIGKRHYYQMSELSASFKVSSRTIRYDMDEIEYFITKYSGAKLIRKYGKGIFVDASPDDLEKISNAIETIGLYNFSIDEDQKTDLLIITLMMTEKPLTSDELANQLNIGKTTLYSLLNRSETYFHKFDIQLLRKSSRGLSIKANEHCWRQCMKHMLMSKIHLENFFNLINYSKFSSKDDLDISVIMYSEFNKIIFNDIDIKNIYLSLKDAQEKGIYLADISILSTLIILIIIIKRIKTHHYIGSIPLSDRIDRRAIEYLFAKTIVENLKKNCNISLPSDEIDYIALHLLSERKTICNIENDSKYVNFALKLMFQVQEELGEFIPLTETFLKDLVIHLKPAIVRAYQKVDEDVENPLLDTIKLKYRDLFCSVKKACYALNKNCNEFPLMSDNEISYLTMHIGSLLHIAYPHKKNKPKLLLVCSEGIAISKMLSVRILEEFPMVDISQASLADLKELELDKYDLLLSTFYIPLKSSIPFLQVGPTIESKDIKNISTLLNIRNFGFENKRIFNQEVLEQLMDVIQKNCQIFDVENLEKAMKKILKISERKEDVNYMLSDLITINRISIGYKAVDWEDAVRKAGNLLRDDGCCDDNYVDAMIETVKELGPYIVVAKGIALPHAKPEKGSKKIGMSLVILKNEICFGSKQNDPVRAVFGLCAVDSTSHIQALSDLGTFAMDNDSFNTLLNFDQKDKIIEYINETCKKIN